MVKQRESKLSRRIANALKEQGHFVFKVHGSEFMMAGLPDLICCARGRFIGLETKNPESRDNVSARQGYVHTLIRRAGGVAEVVTSVDEALALVARTLEDRA